MIVTVRSLAEKYGVTINNAIEALANNGLIVLSVDSEILGKKLDRYERVIQSLVIDPIEKQKRMLSRDYVIFTYMALRKPITAKIIWETLEVHFSRHTKTKIVVCEESIQYVIKAANNHVKLQKTVKYLQDLKEHQMLTILPGRISEENHAISSFIKTRNLSDSILIVGVNRSLSTFVHFRNKNNQNNRSYITIFERDVDAKGFLVDIRKQRVAFANPQDKEPAPYSDKPTNLKGSIPTEKQNVYCKKSNEWVPVLLEEEIARGGEAIVYKIPLKNKCAKIFNAKSNSELKKQKILIMCSKYGLLKGIDPPIMERISWPEKLLFNEQGEFVGYIMSFFKDTTPFSDFAYDTFEEIIPGVRKEHQVTMAVNFAELIDFMHHNNIILCDINRKNILFDKNQMAYLVDLDSAQIADSNYYYPSNVGIPEFLSPEHIYARDFSFKRKKADDVWILQMLLFHMLTPDGDPYDSDKQVDDDREYTAKGYYPYQAGNKSAEKAIRGTPWHMIVSHFPKFVKEMFWNSFHGDGKYFHEADRKPAIVWLNTMVHYQECLPDMIKTDAESGKYMPTAYRKYVQKNKVDITGGSLEDLMKKFGSSGAGNKDWDDIN